MACATAAPAFSMRTTPGMPTLPIVRLSASRISAAVSSGFTPLPARAPQPYGHEHERREGESVGNEDTVVARAHPAEQGADAREARERGDDHPDDRHARLLRLEQVRYLQQRRTERDGHRQQEAEARCGVAPIAEQ